MKRGKGHTRVFFMCNIVSKREFQDGSPEELYGAAGPPDVLAAKVAALLRPHLAEAVREQNERLLQEHRALKPLLSLGDVARTLKKSVRSCETMLAAGELPPPLWIGGVRRWHPDTIAAYLRAREVAR